ncbi:MAG: glycosyltransferase family 39 protein [Nitrospirota bacterium]|nr:glycosyltransferase family 39 protein [Nitrospirota bacterium]
MNQARKTFIVIIAAFTVFRLWYVQSGILDLAADEAQYWDWSRNLDLSYYSKGPLIAWLIGFFTRLGGDTVLFVRLGAVLCALGTSIIFYRLVWRMTGRENIALYAATALQVIPLFSAGGVLMTIDPPLVFLWALAIYALCLVFFDDRKGWWYLFGICLGLGLLAKYSMAYVVLGLLFFLVFSKTHRHWLGRKEPYLALLLGGVIFSPVIYWNARHGWVAARHVAGQVPDVEKAGISLSLLGEFVGSQAGILSPLVFIGIIYGLYAAARQGFKHRNEAMLFLFSFSGTILITMTLLSAKGKVQANWAAPAYFTAGVATAVAIGRLETSARLRGFLIAALSLSMLMSTVIYNTDMVRALGVPWNPKNDPTSRLKGWQELGEAASEVRRSMGTEERTFVLSDRYQISSEMAFYMDGQPHTYCVNLGRRMNQFDIWGGLNEQKGKDAVLVVTGTGYFPAELKESFDRYEQARTVTITRTGRELHHYTIFKCYGFRGFETKETGRY